jgi:hypothetical protein
MAFTHQSRIKNLPDIQRTFMWELFIPSIAELNTDEMVVRIRNVQLPGRTIAPIESYFMGTKAFYPGRSEYTGTFTTQIEEFEDQKVHQAIHSWQELMFSYEQGKQGVASKNDLVKPISLIMYKANGEKLPKKVIFQNAWPQAMADVTLDYSTAESVKYDITWQYDYWKTVNT